MSSLELKIPPVILVLIIACLMWLVSLFTTGVSAHAGGLWNFPRYLYSLVPIAGFIVYMNRFQIVPEECALIGMFGSQYEAYMGQVRRWV